MSDNEEKKDGILFKKILITGKNSFIGQSLEHWMMQSKFLHRYQIDTVDTMGDEWKDIKFSEYDVVFHVAGIAHVDLAKLDEKTKQLYYKVNRDLTVDIATKAKEEGVKQFIFMSSSIVFGDSGQLGKVFRITMNTIPTPSSVYGDSKLQADIKIQDLNSSSFHVVSLRPPMIYGKDCKGNYPVLSKFARKIPIFPDIKNERSMLHVDNLCEFIRLIIDNYETGYFYPQNKEYISTSVMVKTIADMYGKHMILTKIFNPFLFLLAKRIKLINKVFGNFSYVKEMSNYQDYAYCIHDFRETIKQTEL